MIIVGIDPGVTGAIALLDGDDVRVYDMPRDMDGIAGATVYRLLTKWDPAEVYIERTHAMPANGSKATYSLGDSNGSIRTAVLILRIPLIWVTPRQWKNQYSLFGGAYTERERKDRSRWRAQELFPTLADQLTRVKDHNRAEALLIAEYGRRTSITKAVTQMTNLPPDRLMNAWREAGHFECRCPVPKPTPISLFATVQCLVCLRPIPRHTHQQGSPI